MTQAFGGGPDIPEYPETPPLGFAVTVDENRLEAHVVVPAAALEGLSEYIQRVSE